jgi:hypothetical protein
MSFSSIRFSPGPEPASSIQADENRSPRLIVLCTTDVPMAFGIFDQENIAQAKTPPGGAPPATPSGVPIHFAYVTGILEGRTYALCFEIKHSDNAYLRRTPDYTPPSVEAPSPRPALLLLTIFRVRYPP